MSHEIHDTNHRVMLQINTAQFLFNAHISYSFFPLIYLFIYLLFSSSWLKYVKYKHKFQ
jgi:hypothetical protein